MNRKLVIPFVLLVLLMPVIYWLTATRFLFLIPGKQENEVLPNIGGPAKDDVVVSALTHRQKILGKENGWRLKIGESTIDIDDKASKLVRRGEGGRIEWATPLDLGDYSWVSSPRLLMDSKRIYVRRKQDGVMAIEPDTGKVIWRSDIPVGSFWLSGDLLILAYRWDVVGLSVDTGAPVFRTKLPVEIQSEILESGGLFIVEGESERAENAFFLDRAGKIRHRFPRQIVDAISIDQDRVLVTSNEIVRLTSNAEISWSINLSRQWVAGGRIIKLESGDLVVFRFGHINDSGVQVVRLNPENGVARWFANCESLGVFHSKYTHRAEVEIEKDQLRVTSRGERTFVELLDLASGVQIERKIHDRNVHEE